MAPQRIVSLVPSLTELLFWLGVGHRVVGRTKFCTEPAGEVERVPAFGGTKDPQVARIIAIQPDLVIANKEENRQEDVEALESAGLRVLLTDPNTIPETLKMIFVIGEQVGATGMAQTLAFEVALSAAASHRPRKIRACVVVWHNPLMVLGGESYGTAILQSCNVENVFANRPRYPSATLDEIRALAPQLILLPDEPFPFDESHARLYGEIAPTRVIDGKLLWWYGPRIPDSLHELSELLAEYR